MQITPQKFAHMLKNSSLDKSQQKAILDILPHLTLNQIQEISTILTTEAHELENLLNEANSQKQRVQLKLNLKLEKTKLEHRYQP